MPADNKTIKRTEGAATAVQAMHGNSFSANRVDPDPNSSTSFSDDFTGLPDLPCSGNDALVGNDAAAPKSCPSPLEMRTATAAGGLLPTGKTSTATMTILHQLRLPGRRDKFEDFNSIRLAQQHFLQDKQPASTLKQNRGEIWFSIPAGRQVVSAPACFWERGARCFFRRMNNYGVTNFTCESFTPCVLRLIAVFSAARLI